MQVQHEDYSISKLKHSTQDFGIEGLVYEILSWDKKYERASLAVCSNWIKAVVVKDFESLISLAEFVTDKKLPKLKIIPLESIPEVKIESPKYNGVLGIRIIFENVSHKLAVALKSGISLFELTNNTITSKPRVAPSFNNIPDIPGINLVL